MDPLVIINTILLIIILIILIIAGYLIYPIYKDYVNISTNIKNKLN